MTLIIRMAEQTLVLISTLATTGVGAAVGMIPGTITGMILGIVTALGGLIPAGIMARVGASVGDGAASMPAGMTHGGDLDLIGVAATGVAVIIGEEAIGLTSIQDRIDIAMADILLIHQ